MRKAFSVVVLVLALSCPVFAGEIHNPAPQPTPDTIEEPLTTQASAGDFELQNPPTVSWTEAASLTEMALELFALLPSLL